MVSQIVAIFCQCDDALKGLHHHEDPQYKMSGTEVMTTSIITAAYFGGNMKTTRTFLKEQGYIPSIPGKSRFNRRQHRIAGLFHMVFNLLAMIWKDMNDQSFYVLDNFPITACDNNRILRSRRYRGEV
jgi:hypothetical protein